MIIFAYLLIAGVSAVAFVGLQAAGFTMPAQRSVGVPQGVMTRRERVAMNVVEENQIVPDSLAGGGSYSLPDYNFRNILQRKPKQVPKPKPYSRSRNDKIFADIESKFSEREHVALSAREQPPAAARTLPLQRVPDQISRRVQSEPKTFGVDTTARDVIQSVIRGGRILIDKIKPRGIRNNNPGNIRHGSKWQGLSAEQGDDAFAQFDTPEFGIRALAVLLRNYEKKYGINTIRGIISRYAPSNENDTNSYSRAVAVSTGYGEDQPLDLSSDVLITNIIKAIIKHENGEQPYALATIDAGVSLA